MACLSEMNAVACTTQLQHVEFESYILVCVCVCVCVCVFVCVCVSVSVYVCVWRFNYTAEHLLWSCKIQILEYFHTKNLVCLGFEVDDQLQMYLHLGHYVLRSEHRIRSRGFLN